MKIEELKEILEKNNFDQKRVETTIQKYQKFKNFVENKNLLVENVSLEEFDSYLTAMDKKDVNFDFIVALLVIYRRLNRKEIVSWIIDHIEGMDGLDNMLEKVETQFGLEEASKILEGFQKPFIMSSVKEKACAAKDLSERLQKHLKSETEYEIFMTDNFHKIPKENFMWLRELFLETNDLDQVIKASYEKFYNQLKECRDENKLFWGQDIDDQVLDWVEKEQDIETGSRKGDYIILSKIGYECKKYLNETDSVKKRYFYCHCPFVKHSILHPEDGVPKSFCQCSAGFSKVRWDTIFDTDTEAEVVDSVYHGGDKCTFKIKIPEKYR